MIGVKIKTSEEIEIMKKGGEISSQALKMAIEMVEPGMILREIDRKVDHFITSSGALASFKTVEDYKYATCININEGIVHGIPNEREIKKGDVVSIDLGVLYKGFHTDVSWSVQAGSNSEEKFLETGRRALNNAIFECVEGNRLGDISYAIQKIIESAGYSVSQELVGHGVGRELHEDPYIPGYGKRGRGLELRENMVFAIEVIYQKGCPDIVLDKDGWTFSTRDKSLSGLFEATVAVGKNNSTILATFNGF